MTKPSKHEIGTETPARPDSAVNQIFLLSQAKAIIPHALRGRLSHAN
jgi:hypothetical protein